jgi:glycosyltransferase involved in cell wall biosynthesis
MLLSIIVPTFKRGLIAHQCIQSILDADIDNCELIIINDDNENEFKFESTSYSSINYTINNNPKSGVASARNYGASIAKGNLLLFIDDDMIVSKKSIIEVIDYLGKNANAIYNANWTYSDETIQILNQTCFGRFLISIGFHHLKGWNNNPTDWLNNRFYISEGCTSQFIGIKNSVFKSVGGYNENFPLAGFEDFDFAQRLAKIGAVFTIDTTSSIVHNELDKLDPESWLERKYRGGLTQRVAVDMGYENLSRQDSKFKRFFFNQIFRCRKQILFFLGLIDNMPILDYVYKTIFSALIGAFLSTGYYKENRQKVNNL